MSPTDRTRALALASVLLEDLAMAAGTSPDRLPPGWDDFSEAVAGVLFASSPLDLIVAAGALVYTVSHVTPVGGGEPLGKVNVL